MQLRVLVSSATAVLLATSTSSCKSTPTEAPGECIDGSAPAASEPPAATSAAAPPIAPTEDHPFSVLDMLAMARISSPTPSPDGRQIAFERRDTDMEADRGRTHLWVVDTAGGEPRQLTRLPEGAGGAQWARDGKSLYFLSSHEGSSQVWRVDAAGGEPHRVTELAVAVANLRLAPDGKHLVVSAALPPSCSDLACAAAALAARGERKSSGELYTRGFVRHWDTWSDATRSHLLAVTLGEDGEAIDPRAATILTRGLDADVPSTPFGGPEELAFTPDAQGIVFTARDAGGKNGEPWSTNFDLFVVALDGKSAAKPLTVNPAWDTRPLFSPDGKTLAYLAMERPGYEADRFRVILRDWASGEERVLTKAWDRSVGDMSFAADGARLFVSAEDLGRQPIFSIALADATVTKLVGEGTCASPVVAGERLVFLRDSLRMPAEIWSAKFDGSDAHALTHVNDERVARAHMGEPEQFHFRGAKGDEVYGWIVKPVDFDPQRKYPLAFLIHGGPQGSFGDHFHYRWNPQFYAGAGYAVVMIDFHGSTGYGQAFTDAIRDDWGGKPLVDLDKGLAHVERAYPWIDTTRACALGASYGGYMINWLAGKRPDRFACLVNHDGIFDQRMMYYATEELWFPEWEHKGPYHQRRSNYERDNPANLVDRWRTPMLVVHGGLDYRVPVEQGLATFTALQRLGIESRLLHFPDENHWVLRPSNSKLWHDTVRAWLDEHTGAEPR